MKTQQISRKNAKLIYNSVCDSWKKQIEEILSSQQFEETITVDEEIIKKGYEEAEEKTKELLKKYFKIKFLKKITDDIKNWKDVLRYSGKKESDILPWKNPKNKQQVSQNAFAKIQVISEVLNEGWSPNFKDLREYKYYPWFEYKDSLGGFGFHSSDYGSSSCSMGFVCYFKTTELSNYAGNQFLNIYKDYLENIK